ncbi:MAG: hypothetical protein NTX49_07435 [Chlamydiae bacterium]|nr:hypothetical protein [Chlamydiota bacterium]
MASSLTSTSSHASYITERNPGKYGGRQEDYISQSHRAIEVATRQIGVGVSEGKDVTALFYEVLRDLSAARQNIAIAHGTNSAESFGRKRELPCTPEELARGENARYIGAFTLLDGEEYSEYNSLFLDRLQRALRTLRHDIRGFSQTTYEETKKVLGRVNKFSAEVLTGEVLLRLGTIPTIEELNAAITIEGRKPENIIDFVNSREAMLSLKSSAPDLDKRLRMSHYLKALAIECPSPTKMATPSGEVIVAGNPGNLKSMYVLATNRLEVDGKLYAISQYLTWMYCNYSEDPVDRMKRHSKVMVIHQDTFLIETTLKNIAKIFQEAILWNRDKEGLTDLKNKVALLRYEFSHNMPFQRGSAAIAEWLEAAVYRYHGFTEFRHVKTSLTDLEALTSLTVDDFMKRYDRTIIMA